MSTARVSVDENEGFFGEVGSDDDRNSDLNEALPSPVIRNTDAISISYHL